MKASAAVSSDGLIRPASRTQSKASESLIRRWCIVIQSHASRYEALPRNALPGGSASGPIAICFELDGRRSLRASGSRAEPRNQRDCGHPAP